MKGYDNEFMNIRIKRLSPDASIPEYAHGPAEDAAWFVKESAEFVATYGTIITSGSHEEVDQETAKLVAFEIARRLAVTYPVAAGLAGIGVGFYTMATAPRTPNEAMTEGAEGGRPY